MENRKHGHRQIKILFIHQDGLITGSAISLKFLLLGLNLQRYAPLIVLAGEGPLKKELESLGFAVEVVPMRGFWTAPGPKWYRRGALLNLLALFPGNAIVERCKEFNPDIIHINDKAMLVAGLKLKHLGIPIIQHLRSTYFATNTTLFAWLSERAIRYYASFLIGISEDELFEFRGFPRQVVIHNSMSFDQIQSDIDKGENIREEFSIGANQKLITFIGVFSKVKGAWDFIEMVAKYTSLYLEDDVKFMMVARLPDAKKARRGWRKILDVGSENNAGEVLHKMLIKNGMADKIIFTDYRKDVLSIIAAADVLVMCNRLGAMGRQAFEGMAIGTPLVITAGQSGKSSVVIDGVTAKVVPQEAPEVMAKVIHEVITNEADTARLVENAKRYAMEQFDFRKNASKMEKIYETFTPKE